MKKHNNKGNNVNKSTQNTGLKYDRKSGVIKKATVTGFEGFELPPIMVTEERTMNVDGTSIAFGIADRIVVGAYATGKAYSHKEKEKNMRVETYEPIAVAAKVDDGLRIIVNRKFAKNTKKLEALVVYFNTYYLGNRVLRDEAVNRVKIADDLSYIENPEYSGATIEVPAQYEQGKRMLAFVEAAGHSGMTFTGLRVFGTNIGGVANKIAKDENAKLLTIARNARADRKSDYKRMEQRAAEVASAEKQLEELEAASNDVSGEKNPVTETPNENSAPVEPPVDKKQETATSPKENEEAEG